MDRAIQAEEEDELIAKALLAKEKADLKELKIQEKLIKSTALKAKAVAKASNKCQVAQNAVKHFQATDKQQMQDRRKNNQTEIDISQDIQVGSIKMSRKFPKWGFNWSQTFGKHFGTFARKIEFFTVSKLTKSRRGILSF